MFVLFIDILGDDEEKRGYKLFKENNIMHLLLSKKIILGNITGKIEKIKNKCKLLLLKRTFMANKVKNLAILYSDTVEKLGLKSSIKLMLGNYIESIYEVKSQNMMKYNWKKYLDNFIQIKGLKQDDVRILYFLENYNEEIYENILENINKYKYLDVSYLGDTNSYEYSRIMKQLDYINNELGSTIQNISYNCDEHYNVYFNFTNIDVKQKYKIQGNNLIIDWYFPKRDNLNENNIILKNNYYRLKKILAKLYCNIDNYDSTKLGYILKNNMISK